MTRLHSSAVYYVPTYHHEPRNDRAHPEGRTERGHVEEACPEPDATQGHIYLEAVERAFAPEPPEPTGEEG